MYYNKVDKVITPTMTKIILIRHGETDINARGLTHKTNDVATLTELGAKQIEATSQKLSNIGVDRVICSDEDRAIESASMIANTLGIEFSIESHLKERNWGELEGRPWSDIKAILDKLSLDERYVYVPPKGESWKIFEERIFGTIERLVNDSKGKTIVVVTHGGVIRALIPKLLGLPKKESFKYDPDNASITIINHKDGKYESNSVNNTEHLSDLR
jgi:broad specificity phosphatase PhoE